MSYRLSKLVAGLLTIVSLLSSVAWSAAEEASTVEADDLSQYKTLTVGYTGPEVAALKQRMYELGYFKKNTVNESYTANTADYVKKFEEMNGLPVDGIADPEMQVLFFSDMALKSTGTLELPEKNVTMVEVTIPETEEAKQVNQRFSEFLAGIGTYSESEIQKNQFRENDRNKYVRKKDLGLFDVSTFSAHGKRIEVEFQAVLLFHQSIDGNEVMAIGVKDRKGNRKITVICWPIRKLMEMLPHSTVVAEKSNKRGEGGMIEKFDSEDEVGVIFESKVGLVLKYHMDAEVKDYGLSDENKEFEAKLLSYFAEKKDANRQFLSVIWRPSGKDINFDTKKFLGSLKTRGKLMEIENYQGFLGAFQDIENLPVVTFFTYRGDL